MKYYIVALFDEESYEDISPIQKKASKKFRANRNSPTAHIALDVLENPNMEKLNSVMEKILKPYKKFKIKTGDNISFIEGSKIVGLNIEDRGYIKKIDRKLKDSLELHGFTTKSFSPDELNISLGNVNYISKDKKIDSKVLLNEFKKDCDNLTLKVSKFEIWKITNNKREICMKSYTLKSF